MAIFAYYRTAVKANLATRTIRHIPLNTDLFRHYLVSWTY